MNKIKAILCAIALSVLGLLPGHALAQSGCAAGVPLVGASLGCGTGTITVGGVNVNASAIPTNGMYLPSASVLGFSANSLRILQMDNSGTTLTAVMGSTGSSAGVSLTFAQPGTGNWGSWSCASGLCVLDAISLGNAAYLVLQTNNNTGLDITPNQLVRFKAGFQSQDGTPTPTGTGTPSMVSGSSDSAGEVISGTSATSVIVSFATTKSNAPFCTVTPQSQLLAFAYTISTTAITITQTATSGEKIDYVCFQH